MWRIPIFLPQQRTYCPPPPQQNQNVDIQEIDDSEEDSSDIVFLGKAKSSDIESNKKIIDKINYEELAEIENVIYDRNKLHLILCHLNGVNPDDPIFNEFYNKQNS